MLTTLFSPRVHWEHRMFQVRSSAQDHLSESLEICEPKPTKKIASCTPGCFEATLTAHEKGVRVEAGR